MKTKKKHFTKVYKFKVITNKFQLVFNVSVTKEGSSDGDDIEIMDSDKKTIHEKLSAPPKTNKKSLPERTTCATIFGNRTKTEGELMFFQFPDTLPGQAMTKDDEDYRPKIKREAVSEQGVQKQSKEVIIIKLVDWPVVKNPFIIDKSDLFLMHVNIYYTFFLIDRIFASGILNKFSVLALLYSVLLSFCGKNSTGDCLLVQTS